MLSANGSDGKQYISGAVPNPKSRTYTCPHPKCGLPVSHVIEHTRSLQHMVTEHFRHPADASHPVKQNDWQCSNIAHALKDAFDGLNCYELSFDKFYTDSRGQEHYAEMSIKDKIVDKEAVVRIETGAFKAKEFDDMLRHLSSQGLFTMLLLSAHGYSNPNGQYFRDYSNPRHEDRAGLKKISGNELAMYKKLRELLYYDHDKFEFASARFRNFVADEKYDHRTGEWVAGETEYETIKVPKIISSSRKFIPVFTRFGEGPAAKRTVGIYPIDDSKVPVLNKMYELKQAIDAKDANKVVEHGESLGIMLEKADDNDILAKRLAKLMDKAWNEVPDIR